MSEKLPLIPQAERHGSLAGRMNTADRSRQSVAINRALNMVQRMATYQRYYVETGTFPRRQLEGEIAQDFSWADGLYAEPFRAFHDRRDPKSGLLH